jgi:hypothetical protein
MILKFLVEFAALSKSEQKVFLFCIQHHPTIYAHSGDIQAIAAALSLYYQTTRRALNHIASLPTLSKCINYAKGVTPPAMVSLDALLLDGSASVDFDFDNIEFSPCRSGSGPLEL